MRQSIAQHFPALNSKNSYPIFLQTSIRVFKKTGSDCVSQRTIPKITYFYLYDALSQKDLRIALLTSICVKSFNFKKSLIRSLSNRPAYGNQVLRGDVGVQKLVKSGIMVGVPKTPRPRESYAWHKQTINGMPHRKRNRLPRHTARTTNCFQTVRSHLTGLLCLLDCP